MPSLILKLPHGDRIVSLAKKVTSIGRGPQNDVNLDPSMQLSGVDNIAASRAGDVIIAEDRGNMELVLIGPGCEASPVVRVIGQNFSELTGPAFDPTGRRLLFNSQRGGATRGGITYEITGPFRRV